MDNVTSLRCPHACFAASVEMTRLAKVAGGPPTGYAADVRVRCADCGLPFRFVGLGSGVSSREPRVSPDGTELRAPMVPLGQPHPADGWKIVRTGR